MKTNNSINNNFFKILSLSLIVILLSIIIIYLFFYNERLIHIKFELLPATSNTIQSIDTKSMRTLESILSKYKSSTSNDFLLTTLESQRNFFISIITVLSLLVALVGIYSLIQKYYDKEHENHLLALIDEAKNEIINIKSDRVEILIDTYATMVSQNIISTSYLENGTEVSGVSTFKQYIIEKLNNIIPYLRNTNNHTYPIAIINLIEALYGFALKKRWVKLDYNINNNFVLSTIFNYLYSTLSKEDYELVKNDYTSTIKKHMNKDVIF